jgi:hypothetical protein
VEGVVEEGRRGNIFVQSKGGVLVACIISRFIFLWFAFCSLLLLCFVFLL